MEKQLGKNLLFNTAGSLVFYVCQAAINLLVVALAGIEAGGVLGVAMTAANVCVSFASYGMRTFQVSDLARRTGGGVWALLAECLPLAVYASLNTAIGSAPRYYCERLLGETALGCFNSVFVPVLVLQVGAVYLFVPFITRFSRLWSGRERAGFFAGLRWLFAGLGALWAAGAAGVALLGGWGLRLLYPNRPEVWAWAGLLQPLVLCCVLTVLATALCNLLIIARGMRGLILGNLAGLCAALLCSPGLIGRWGLYGAAFATMAGLGVQSACLLAALLGRCKARFAPPGAG